MVLLQIDPGRRTVFPFERQAPWSVHMNRIALRLAMQGVEVETWLTKLIQRGRGMQRVEANNDATLQAGRNLRRSPGLEKVPEPTVAIAPDHAHQL